MDALEERLYEILRLILIDYAEQNIGPNANLPSSSIRVRMMAKNVMNMDDLVSALDEAVNRSWLKYLSGTAQERYELTETGYTISRQLLRGEDVSLEREKHLKDCPFCDCEVVGASLNEDRTGYSVTCENCGARGPLVEITEESTPVERQAAVAEAFSLWNTRGHQ